MLLFSPKWLFLLPGLLLSVLGVISFVALSVGPIRLGRLGLDIHSLLYSSGAIVIGFLLLQFALLMKWVGAIVGVSTPGKWLDRANRWASVEWGLLLGGALFIGGLAWSVYLAGSWSGGGFSELDPRQKMRSVIPAVTLMIVGLQACAGAFLAAALHLTWKTVKHR